jgi:lysozyme family protein|tara:strand:- start:38 stop:550 length:513 start_codon:yes stop_codon:yes gene_type:complete
MEANFFKSLEIVLKHEGGFVDHPEDPGGATNKGITHKTYSDFLGRPLEDVSELKNIPDEHVQQIYKDGYWNRVKADQLPSGVDFCTFDWAVNSGPGRAAKALQKAAMVTQDGAIGPMTLAAVEEELPEEIIEKITKEREEFYRSLRTFDTFGKGWLRRNEETRDFALEMI